VDFSGIYCIDISRTIRVRRGNVCKEEVRVVDIYVRNQ